MSEQQAKREVLMEAVEALRKVEKAQQYDNDDMWGICLALDAVRLIAVEHGVAKWSTLANDEVVFIDKEDRA